MPRNRSEKNPFGYVPLLLHDYAVQIAIVWAGRGTSAGRIASMKAARIWQSTSHDNGFHVAVDRLLAAQLWAAFVRSKMPKVSNV